MVLYTDLSVNFWFKSLLLLQFILDHSEFFTGETRHIVPPCNKAGISNFCLEFQEFQEFQISLTRYSSFSSYSIILNFFTGETRHVVHASRIFQFLLRIQDFFKMLLLLHLDLSRCPLLHRSLLPPP